MRQSLASALPSPSGKSLSASLTKSEGLRPTGTKLSDRQIAAKWGRRVSRAMEIARITAKSAQEDCGYANPSPISKLLNPPEAPAIAKLMELKGFVAAWIEVLAEDCPEYRRVVTLERKQA